MPDTAEAVLEYLDPGTLLVDLNIREADVTPGFVASIKDLGVLEPIVAYRSEAGIRVRFGHRRTLGAVKAGRKLVPVMLFPTEPTGTKADIERVVGQVHENTEREGLSGKDATHAVALLLDLGLTAAQIVKRTPYGKDQVAAAQKITGSESASAAATDKALSLEHLAGIAEFDGDDKAVKKLTDAAHEDDGTFRHILQKLRNDRTLAEAKAAKVAELEAAGIQVSTDGMSYENQTHYWAGPDGKVFTDGTHMDCPGNVATVAVFWRHGEDVPDTRVSYYCKDPKANGHRKYTTASAGKDSEEQRAERRVTIAGNKEWRAAETVRREWLREFAARKSAPAGAVRFLCEAIASGDTSLQRSMQYPAHKLGTELLGIDGEAYDAERLGALEDLFAKASDTRAQVIALTLVLAAQESSTGVQTWRNPTSHGDTALYLSALAGWGYGPSAIERAVMAGKPYTPDTGDTSPADADPEPDPDQDSDD